VTLELAPADVFVQSQGVSEFTTFLEDQTYHTMHPIRHTFYAGVEGFVLDPKGDFVGAGPGALPHETRSYAVMNRWAVDQEVEIFADVAWVRFDGVTGPVTRDILPQKGSTVELGLDATGLARGTYSGTVTWRSLDSGSPSFERTSGVLMDVGREVFGGAFTPPLTFTIDDANPLVQIPIAVGGIVPGTVADADIRVQVVVTSPENAHSGPRLSIVSPSNTVVQLITQVPGSLNVTFDDDTHPPSGELADFDDESYHGDWLRFDRTAGNAESYDVTLSLAEVRLYVDRGEL
jgi:hypothetical protein